MSRTQPSLPFRNDTVLGVCEGLGQDFGFHANWLRLAFALAFYASPTIVTGVYLGLGLLVATSRFVYPDHRSDKAVIRSTEPAPASIDVEERLPLAA